MQDTLHKTVECDEAQIHKHMEYDVSHLNFNKDMVHVKIKLSMLNIQNQEHIGRLEQQFQAGLLKLPLNNYPEQSVYKDITGFG